MSHSTSFRVLQGASDRSYCRPPLDGSLTIPELYLHQALHTPERTVFVYADEYHTRQDVTYSDTAQAMNRAAKIVLDHLDSLPTGKHGHIATNQSPMKVAILALADNITFGTMILGIMRCGHTAFPISPLNSAAAVAHLIRTTDTRHVFVSSDPSMQKLAQGAREMLVQDGLQVHLMPMPHFEVLYSSESETVLDEKRLRKPERGEPVLILHTSGSTSYPKPTYSNTQQYIEYGTTPYFGEVDMCGYCMGMQALAMFHIMAAGSLAWAPCSGMTLAFLRPSSPPIRPTPDIALESIMSTQSEIVVAPPILIEAWANKPAYIDSLKRLKRIFYGGAPVRREVGTQLVQEGIRLTSGYGMTEIGYGTMIVSADVSLEDWEYFALSPHTEPALVPHEGGLHELFFLECTTHHPSVIDSTINGKPAFATKDLVEQHATRPDLWRLSGRVDDQIALKFGEKTNPVPLESTICVDPNVAAAVMFGIGRLQNGVLVQPAHSQKNLDATAFRELIWPTIEKCNEIAPSHSRIPQELVLVTSPGKPMELTSKGNVRRQSTLNAYAAEIEDVYGKLSSNA
ncbi:acetyl-CoA synthetase-like protein [Peniophora sp. CONT]|nr:acetyl-CoA synthetase-like protein [Peniophora sp. CONT]